MSVLSAQVSASATVWTGRGKLKGVYFVGAATAGTLVFKDGGSGGTTKLTINTPPITTSGTTTSGYVAIPDDGILFQTDCYVAVTTAAFATMFYATT